MQQKKEEANTVALHNVSVVRHKGIDQRVKQCHAKEARYHDVLYPIGF
jgi:hypothetical protein